MGGLIAKQRRQFMKIFSKLIAGVGAVLLTAILMALPDLSMTQVPGVTGMHALMVVARAP
jgi:hypothetical protein